MKKASSYLLEEEVEGQGHCHHETEEEGVHLEVVGEVHDGLHAASDGVQMVEEVVCWAAFQALALLSRFLLSSLQSRKLSPCP